MAALRHRTPVDALPLAPTAALPMPVEVVVAERETPPQTLGPAILSVEPQAAPQVAPQAIRPDQAPAEPLLPFTAEAWREAVEALRKLEALPAGMIVTGSEPAEWRACIGALAAAERKIEAGLGTPATANPVATILTVPEAQPVPNLPSERRDPTSRGAAMRRVA